MTSRNTLPGGDSTPGAGGPAPVATTPSSELSLEQRVARIEAALETFFVTLATPATPPAADATPEAGSGPAAAGTPSPRRGVEERLRRLEKQVLRMQLEIGALGAPGEPWDPDASAEELIKRRTDAHAAERHWIVGMLERLRGQPLRLERDDDDDATLEMDALRARAEALARKLLVERDGDELRRRGAAAGCWDADGRLIGVGATTAEAEQDAARHLGAAGVVTRLAAEVPQGEPDDDEFAWLDAIRDPYEQDPGAEFERLGRWLNDRINTLPPDESAVAIRRLDAALLAAGAPRARADALARRLLLERDAEALRRRGARAGCWDFEGRLLGAGATCGDALRDAVSNYGPEPDGVAWLTAALRDICGD